MAKPKRAPPEHELGLLAAEIIWETPLYMPESVFQVKEMMQISNDSPWDLATFGIKKFYR